MNSRVIGAAVATAVLLASGVARAGEPVASAASGIKVGIDASTGRLRPLTEAESAALDAAVPARAAAGATSALRATPGSNAVAGVPESHAVRATRAGRAMKVPLSEMSHITATVGADGQVVVRDGVDGEVLDNAVAKPAEVLE